MRFVSERNASLQLRLVALESDAVVSEPNALLLVLLEDGGLGLAAELDARLPIFTPRLLALVACVVSRVISLVFEADLVVGAIRVLR